VRLRFYLDEDSSDHALVRALRSRGFTVTTPDEAGLLGADDSVHLRWCAQNGHVLVSHNVPDFCRHHRDWLSLGEPHAGIVVMPQQTWGIGEKLRRLVRLSAARSPEEMRNRLEFLTNW
jgi:Domain of unknown function (DUF5615)